MWDYPPPLPAPRPSATAHQKSLPTSTSTSASTQTAGGGSAATQFMTTQQMKRTLVEDLGYAAEEADQMLPQLAAAVIRKGTRRPWGDRPMPDEWKKPVYEEAEEEGPWGRYAPAVAVLVIVALGGAWALSSGLIVL